MRINTAVAALVAFIAFEAHAQTTVDAKPEEKPKLICRTVVATGSRLASKKKCATAAEWQMRADEDRKAVDGWAKRTIPATQQ